jgi:uracil-DNA glycosylase
MVATDPREVFLTNAYIGLPDLARDTAPFPTTPSFVSRCQRLLVVEIELFEPRVIVCLGVPAAKMLASVTNGLEIWRTWPGYRTLRPNGLQTMKECTVGDVTFTAVAVQHPSAVQSTAERNIETALVTAAVR